MAELSIRLKIGDREYPMKVSAEDEEKIRKAGKIINERIRTYRNRFGINDKQDLLAMVAFDCVVEQMGASIPESLPEDTGMSAKIDQLNALINEALQ
ncbi:cell division protein ZapA [Nafulsella turpanensis]|uniref:cell division protein ZapA n=1 Tax=Nafulsella turpanensis TaxID=1265690 RepID=UPI000347A6CB|nr:cell division protein ZapA [Nafulsella turpanensis]